ncbi:hypothetical protein [Azospirillum sp. SYSU D00513]|uniref:hypothetical protein n=1 Tax=Azospirillum sp. SYSU D00513 TaxID=2812561 RepID=UPI001A963235|nr:hypothetical protein [Azospirillum sp. SYSU D00513]
MGTGGSNGATRSPTACIVPARRIRFAAPANDNRAPLGRRIRRAIFYLVVLALIAAVVLL